MVKSKPSILPIIPEDLVTEIVAGKCVIFVGSGLSLRSGYPSWVSLLRQLLEGLKANGLIGQKSYDELVRKLDAGNLLETADTIRRRYGNYTDRYVSRIQNIFAINPMPEPNEAHRLIFEIGFKGIATTNYDTLIENLYDRSKQAFSYQAARVVKNRDINNLFYIFKAHGDILNLEEHQDKAIILTASDYANLRQQDHYSDFLDYLFTHRTLFFIGYSFSDPDINLIRENLAVSQDTIKTHYALIDADSSDISKQNFLDRLRIQSLEYTNQSGNHDEIVAYLRQLKAKVDEARAASKPEVKTAPPRDATQTSVPNAPSVEPSTDPKPQAEPSIDADVEPPSTAPEDEVKDKVESPEVDTHPEPSLLNEPPLPHYEPKPPRKPIDTLGLIGVALAALALLVGILQVIIESQQLATATPTVVAVAATPTPTSTDTPPASHTPPVTPNITDTTQPIVGIQETLTSVFSPSPSETFTATPTDSYTSTLTITSTSTPTATRTIAPTLTSTNTASPTQTYTPTSTFTSTAIPTLVTPTLTPSITQTPTITFTPTNIPCSTTAPNVSVLDFDSIDSEPVSLAAFMAFSADARVINGQGDYLNAPWWDGEKCGDLTQGTAIRHFQLQTTPEKPALVYGHEAAAYCRWQGLTDRVIGGLPTVQIWKEQLEAGVFVPADKEWLQNTAQDEITDDTPYVIADTVSGVEPIYKAAIGEAGSVRQPPGVAFRCVYWKPQQ